MGLLGSPPGCSSRTGRSQTKDNGVGNLPSRPSFPSSGPRTLQVACRGVAHAHAPGKEASSFQLASPGAGGRSDGAAARPPPDAHRHPQRLSTPATLSPQINNNNNNAWRGQGEPGERRRPSTRRWGWTALQLRGTRQEAGGSGGPPPPQSRQLSSPGNSLAHPTPPPEEHPEPAEPPAPADLIRPCRAGDGFKRGARGTARGQRAAAGRPELAMPKEWGYASHNGEPEAGAARAGPPQ